MKKIWDNMKRTLFLNFRPTFLKRPNLRPSQKCQARVSDEAKFWGKARPGCRVYRFSKMLPITPVRKTVWDLWKVTINDLITANWYRTCADQQDHLWPCQCSFVPAYESKWHYVRLSKWMKYYFPVACVLIWIYKSFSVIWFFGW